MKWPVNSSLRCVQRDGTSIANQMGMAGADSAVARSCRRERHVLLLATASGTDRTADRHPDPDGGPRIERRRARRVAFLGPDRRDGGRGRRTLRRLCARKAALGRQDCGSKGGAGAVRGVCLGAGGTGKMAGDREPIPGGGRRAGPGIGDAPNSRAVPWHYPAHGPDALAGSAGKGVRNRPAGLGRPASRFLPVQGGRVPRLPA
jgi:hypothetical protein